MENKIVPVLYTMLKLGNSSINKKDALQWKAMRTYTHIFHVKENSVRTVVRAMRLGCLPSTFVHVVVLRKKVRGCGRQGHGDLFDK